MTLLVCGRVCGTCRVASEQDLIFAEDATRRAVSQALDAYLAAIRGGVFSDPSRPDWVVWPSDLWPQLFMQYVVPVLRDEFVAQLRAEGVTDEQVIAGAAASFVSQLNGVVDDPRVPARVLQETIKATSQTDFQVEPEVTLSVLLTAGALVWAGLLGVVGSNVAAVAVNSAVQVAASRRAVGGGIVVKRWNAVNDDRTRPSHVAVDGAVVGVDGVFTVGGFPLRFPHDPYGPAQETVNCRCVLSFEVRR